MAVKFKKSKVLTKKWLYRKANGQYKLLLERGDIQLCKTIFRVRIEIRLTIRGPIYPGQPPILEISWRLQMSIRHPKPYNRPVVK